VIYLAMAGFGTLCLLLAFGLLAGPDGACDFAAIREAGRSPLAVALALLLVAMGAGSKAGLVPLHVWLPLAHPAAPSHVSALMSGVMTKLALYAIARIGFDLLGVAPWWAGMALMVVGGITAVGGILYAMLETDLKRVLACSTIENIGVVTAALGLALAFRANAMAVPAALALTAALFHMLNHALFKSLLFLGAGAVLGATGTAEMDRLGGLIHRMRITSVMFLAGSVAISALPPLNGFASEWLLFQAILQSPALPQWGLKIAAPAVGALLALAAALAAACFVRAFGVAFLGRPRSAEAQAAHETDRFSLAAMGALVALCVLAGVLPGLVIDALAPVATLLSGARLPAQAGNAWLTIMPAGAARGTYNGLLLLLFVAASAMLAAALVHRLASRALRRGPAWGCGFTDAAALNQYGGPSFAQPIRRVFAGPLFGAREVVEMPPPGAVAPARYRAPMQDPAWAKIFDPIAGAVDFAAGKLNALQFLTIRRYLSLVFLSLVGLLLALAVLT
jgi:formate hydrogenlyase subunit 3/multisubunit Na+/H+ antiporter MnhD subunit